VSPTSIPLHQADGGWNRVVWLSMLKERLQTIPADLIDKIAAENDATDIQSLKAFSEDKNQLLPLGNCRGRRKKRKKKEVAAAAAQ
jgi:acetyl-CoA decarbonylase/synthase complex subunit beta